MPFFGFTQNAAPVPIATPEQSGANYLYGSPKNNGKAWGGRVIRNVVAPTIYTVFSGIR